MIGWERVRWWVLLVTFTACAAILARVVFARLPLERPLAPYLFPESAALPGWEALPASASPAFTSEHPGGPAIAHYRFRRGDALLNVDLRAIADLAVHYIKNPLLEMRFLPHGYLPLDAEMVYLVDPERTVRINTAGNSMGIGQLEVRERNGIGSYGFWREGGRLHLSATLTPDGKSYATRLEVARHTYFGQLSGGRFWAWLSGREPLPDTRCATLHLALKGTAEGNSSLAELEGLWEDWRQHCAGHFPSTYASPSAPAN